MLSSIQHTAFLSKPFLVCWSYCIFLGAGLDGCSAVNECQEHSESDIVPLLQTAAPVAHRRMHATDSSRDVVRYGSRKVEIPGDMDENQLSVLRSVPILSPVMASSRELSQLFAEASKGHTVVFWCLLALLGVSVMFQCDLAVLRLFDELRGGPSELSILTIIMQTAAQNSTFTIVFCIILAICYLFLPGATHAAQGAHLQVSASMVMATAGLVMRFRIVGLVPKEVSAPAFGQDIGHVMSAQLRSKRRLPGVLYVIATIMMIFGTVTALLKLIVLRDGVLPDGVVPLSPTMPFVVFMGLLYFVACEVILASEQFELHLFSTAAVLNARHALRQALMAMVLFHVAGALCKDLVTPDKLNHDKRLLHVKMYALAITSCLCIENLVVGFYIDNLPVDQWKSAALARAARPMIAGAGYVATGALLYFVVTEVFHLQTRDKARCPALECVTVLMAIFFGVQFVQRLTACIQEFSEVDIVCTIEAFAAAGEIVSALPLLGVLCVSCQFYALQRNGSEGRPQWWAEDAMYIGLVAVSNQLLLIILIPVISCFFGSKIDTEGRTVHGIRHTGLLFAANTIKYASKACFHFSLITIYTSLFATLLLPETANMQETLKSPHLRRMPEWGILAGVIVAGATFLISSYLAFLRISSDPSKHDVNTITKGCRPWLRIFD